MPVLTRRRPTSEADAEKPAGSRGASERVKLLRYVQPSLIGLIGGTISTLAPIFAAAYAANSRTASPSSSSSSRSSASAF